MTKMLAKAFTEASKLPEAEQNVQARWLLEELELDKKWDRLFAESEDLLEKLADDADLAWRRDKTEPLDPDKL